MDWNSIPITAQFLPGFSNPFIAFAANKRRVAIGIEGCIHVLKIEAWNVACVRHSVSYTIKPPISSAFVFPRDNSEFAWIPAVWDLALTWFEIRMKHLRFLPFIFCLVLAACSGKDAGTTAAEGTAQSVAEVQFDLEKAFYKKMKGTIGDNIAITMGVRIKAAPSLANNAATAAPSNTIYENNKRPLPRPQRATCSAAHSKNPASSSNKLIIIPSTWKHIPHYEHGYRSYPYSQHSKKLIRCVPRR